MTVSSRETQGVDLAKLHIFDLPTYMVSTNSRLDASRRVVHVQIQSLSIRRGREKCWFLGTCKDKNALRLTCTVKTVSDLMN